MSLSIDAEQMPGGGNLSHCKLLLPTPARGARQLLGASFAMNRGKGYCIILGKLDKKLHIFALAPAGGSNRFTTMEDDAMAEHATNERFVPKGAIAFFAALVVVYAMLWFAVYAELLGRR